jgi:hypothetical protein
MIIAVAHRRCRHRQILRDAPVNKKQWRKSMASRSLWLCSLAVAAGAGWFAATAFSPAATGKEPRFPVLTMD